MQAEWYFDFVSPFSYLQWPEIRALGARMPITPRPVIVGALFDHHGSLGPAEQPAKRRFTYRFALWQAQQLERPLRFPPAHPFNPIPVLRLCLAAGNTADAITTIFDWIWAEGRAADTPEALAELGARLGIADVVSAVSADTVKQALRDNFSDAVASQVFGVPTLVAEGHLFFGNDATPMLQAWLADPALFDTAEMQRLDTLPVAAKRAAVTARLAANT